MDTQVNQHISALFKLRNQLRLYVLISYLYLIALVSTLIFILCFLIFDLDGYSLLSSWLSGLNHNVYFWLASFAALASSYFVFIIYSQVLKVQHGFKVKQDDVVSILADIDFENKKALGVFVGRLNNKGESKITSLLTLVASELTFALKHESGESGFKRESRVVTN